MTQPTADTGMVRYGVIVMPRPRKYDTAADRRLAQNDQRKARRASDATTEFVAVDGEGIGRGRSHRYVLLGCGDYDYIQNSAGLTWHPMADFLYGCYLAKPKAAFVGFYLGYDFTQMLRCLPRERAWRLLDTAGIASRARKVAPQLGPFPVTFENWELDILGFKRLKLRPKGEKGWLYICDAGPFFQCSFLKAIDPSKWSSDPVVSEEEYAAIAEGKSRRDTADLDDSMRRYNQLENRVMARLMHRYELGLVQAGIHLRKDEWFGPGQAAQKWMSTSELPTTDMLQSLPRMLRRKPQRNDILAKSSSGRITETILEIAQRTYYGGWFEIFAHGYIPGRSWEYDINSAYPAIASALPCLLHGKWTSGSNVPGELGEHSLRIVYGTVRGSHRQMGAALHRTADGSIRRPYLTRGYYWQAEIDAGIRCGSIDSVEYLEWWQYDSCNCEPPLAGLRALYEQRIRAGKDTPYGKALKLVYNSVYGKLAQSVGSPKFGNSIYASLITSGCRTMILDAISSHPFSQQTEGPPFTVMIATDAIFFTERHTSLPLSERIGEWSEISRNNLTLFKPGVYWDDSTRERIRNGTDPSFKSRGIKASDFAGQISDIDKHYSLWPQSYPAERDPAGDREGWHPQIKFTSGFSMITCQQALQRGRWNLAGTLGHNPIPGVCDGCDGNHLVQDADPIQKRHSGWLEAGIYWSRPYPDGGAGEIESTPYDKRFGQPDPDEYGITDDGTVQNSWGEVLT